MEIELYNGSKGISEELIRQYEYSRDFLNFYSPEDLNDWKKVDLYFLLGIDTLKYETLSETIINKQFKKALLKYHPDLNKRSSPKIFILINKAHEVLTDPLKKRRYDSLIFNESIPADKEYAPQDFFATFIPVFERNAYFSVNKNVPDLGDMQTSIKDVHFFYKFWRNFESWRTYEYFFINSEYDHSNAYQRRQVLAKQKSKMRQKKGEEFMRISNLVETAYKRDPRLQQFKKKVEVNLNYKVNPKLISNGWNENEIKEFGDLLGGPSRKDFGDVDWADLFEKFNLGKENKKEYTIFLVKGKEISRMGLVQNTQPKPRRPMNKSRPR